ncbi:MAG: TonB-dependent receptor plug domain-containing protein [Caulobacteraceae bacterium]
MSADQPPRVEVVVVAAPRLPPSPGDAAFSIIRLDNAALETAPRLDQALEQVPGVSLFRRTSSLGANPTTQGVSLRAIAGSGASRALVNLDGVPQNDAFGGWVIWSALPPEIIGSATIVRGAGAGPYGAGALTGVVALASPDARAGSWSAGARLASLGDVRGAATGALAAGPGVLVLAAAGERSDGWIPVRQGRGPADDRLTLADGFVSARYLTDLGAASGEVRASAYQEDRGAGLVGAVSRARGASLSATAARAPSLTSLGWRIQAWSLVSDLANSSVSVAPNRASTSLANDQYATPAIGYGANAAVRKLSENGTLELGVDVRGAAGEDRERFHPINGVLSADRRAGGQSFIGGAYAEGTARSGPLTLVAGGRVDGWEDFDSHRLERSLVTGETTLDLHPADRGGLAPSGRVAARLDLADGYLRAAAYSGFRPPTLNELHRPFRVGNDVTEANPYLSPERLAGGEIGGGGRIGPIKLDATVFYNRLQDAIINLTLGHGPLVDPVAGFIPAGGTLLQRRNVGAIDAWGVEGEARADLTATLSTNVAVDWTHARIDGGAAATQLTGLRPAETPRLTVTWRLDWRPAPRWELSGDLRYESARFDDDQNTRPLAAAATMDAELDWRAGRRATLFLVVENLFDAAVATGQTADRVTSYGPPRTVAIGVRLRSGG